MWPHDDIDQGGGAADFFWSLIMALGGRNSCCWLFQRCMLYSYSLRILASYLAICHKSLLWSMTCFLKTCFQIPDSILAGAFPLRLVFHRHVCWQGDRRVWACLRNPRKIGAVCTRLTFPLAHLIGAWYIDSNKISIHTTAHMHAYSLPTHYTGLVNSALYMVRHNKYDVQVRCRNFAVAR